MQAPSKGARLGYNDLLGSSPKDPPIEEHTPVIHDGVREPIRATVLPNASREKVPPVFLMRKKDCEQAYAMIPKPPISIGSRSRGDNWGHVVFGVIYERVGSGSSTVFQAPDSSEAKYVAIKILNKRAVRKYLNTGDAEDDRFKEDPYKEIARMQELGDNIHVLQCIEALEDDKYLYIVTPKACSEGTLKDAIPWFSQETMDPERVKSIFRKILKILAYLEKNGVCHRDASPDNFLFLTPDNLVAFDLALSVRTPTDETGRRVLVRPKGNFGTVAWMPPEIFSNRVWDTVLADLWSAAIILYNMLTNQILYREPHPVDISFRYFVLAGGLSSQPINERTVEVLMDTFRPDQAQHEQNELMSRAMAHLNMGSDAVEILENLLKPAASQRWTLAQAMESAYVLNDDLQSD